MTFPHGYDTYPPQKKTYLYLSRKDPRWAQIINIPPPRVATCSSHGHDCRTKGGNEGREESVLSHSPTTSAVARQPRRHRVLGPPGDSGRTRCSPLSARRRSIRLHESPVWDKGLGRFGHGVADTILQHAWSDNLRTNTNWQRVLLESEGADGSDGRRRQRRTDGGRLMHRPLNATFQG
jgi:hypothetical protein